MPQKSTALAALTVLAAGLALFAGSYPGADATGSRPPACTAPTTPTPTPPPLKPTTITTIEQAYHCIFDHYYTGPVLDDRALLVPAFAAFTQELQRRGLDQAGADMPALTGNRERDWAAFAAVYRRVTAGLPDDPAVSQAVAEAVIRGMVTSLRDDHALWLRGPIRGTELGILTNDTQGNAQADPVATPPLFVTTLLASSPAADAGVRPGDEIVSVDGVPPFVDGRLVQGVLNLINDPPGPVRLALHRPATGEDFTVTLTVPQGPPPSGGGTPPPTDGLQVTSRLLREDIAYVQLPGFFSGSADQVLAAVADLGGTARLHGLVLDLRDNTGGAAEEVARLLGAWVHGKAFNYFCDVRDRCTAAYTDNSVPLLHLPLVVLTDRRCASACDGFASSVKDLHLGTLVGTRTAGAASGPNTGYNLDDGSVLGLPSRRALMANKEIIDTIGIAPDYQAPLTSAGLSGGHDAGIDKALGLLR